MEGIYKCANVLICQCANVLTRIYNRRTAELHDCMTAKHLVPFRRHSNHLHNSKSIQHTQSGKENNKRYLSDSDN
jgi:hypothetical protein